MLGGISSDNEDYQGRLLTETDICFQSRICRFKVARNSGHVAFELKSYCEVSVKKRATLDIYSCDGNTLKVIQMTRNPGGVTSSHPVFVTDKAHGFIEDQLLYLKNGKIYTLALCGGESAEVGAFADPVISFKVIETEDDRLFLLLVSDVFDTEDATLSSSPTTSSAMVFDNLMARHWDTWGPYKRRNHLFLCPLGIAPSGLLFLRANDAVDLMSGLDVDCPGKGPAGNDDDYSVSSDGRHVAIACREMKEKAAAASIHDDTAWTTKTRIYTAEISNLTYPQDERVYPPSFKQIEAEFYQGFHSCPLFSNDGKILAFLAMARQGYEADRNDLVLLDIEKREILWRSSDFVDLSFQSIEWSVNTTATIIYASAQFAGTSRIFRITFSPYTGDILKATHIDVMIGDESRSKPLSARYCSGDIGSNIEEALYYTESTLTSPTELKMALISVRDNQLFRRFFSVDSHTSSHPFEVMGELAMERNVSTYVRQVYVPCPEYSNGDIKMPKISSHNIIGARGEAVHVWYLPPVFIGIKPSDRASVPVVLIIHGGPQGAILNQWHDRWNPAFYAAQGYGVVAVNFHGSSGYGQTFTDSIRGDWGGAPYVDCIAALDHMLAQFAYLDPRRCAAIGGSYGGYLVNWMNGHSDRFACFVSHAGIFSLSTLYYATEELWFPEWEFGVPWHEDAAKSYEIWSPSSYVSCWKTPTLVIHGAKDFRVPETEGISTFTALKRRNVPARFLFFPDEHHWVLKPENSVKWYSEVAVWLKKWLLYSGGGGPREF